MSEDITVRVDDLAAVATILFAHLREQVGETVDLEWDYYWSIPKDQLYNPYEAPSDLTMGQISECQEFLDPILRDPERAISYALVWLGDILQAVGHKVVA